MLEECLPRTRGDRPDPRVVTDHAETSPPHPRGSTPKRLYAANWPNVSPAPAGIDPRIASSTCATSRLPRTRGDRPGRWGLTIVHPESPPHPRGSTLSSLLVCALAPVSPAPAGIDPSRAGISTPPRGLPRTRGDRPAARFSLIFLIASPPHPRGSTWAFKGVFTPLQVSPAPAGIDPIWPSRYECSASLPRTRGDRPSTGAPSRHAMMSPPHPRGSTSVDADDCGPCRVSPAPAGIDPFHRHRDRAGLRLPRTRGDRPRMPDLLQGRLLSPPHPRGSTCAKFAF